MDPVELRDLDAARQFVLQSAMLQRVGELRSGGLRAALEWSLVIAASGQPLPPVGFVGDLGHILCGSENDWRPRRRSTDPVGLPAGVARAYEDLVLGHCVIDESLARAGAVIRRLDQRQLGRGIAFVIQQFRDRSPFGGVLLSPGVIKSVLELADADLIQRGWESMRGGGMMPLITDLYAGLIAAIRRRGDVLARADVFELERGTALAELSQRLALRQLLALTAQFVSGLAEAPRPRSVPREVPSHIRDEDVYPVGGFASISNRGSIESLLHSQLAFMESDADERPDLFDVKFLRDELLYYSRDENQYWRRRQRFTFIFTPDLVRTRFKDPELPAQRVICLLAWVCASVQTLTRWLSDDSLQFELYFPIIGDEKPLAHEQALIELLFHDQIHHGQVRCETVADIGVILNQWNERAGATVEHRLLVSAGRREDADLAGCSSLVVDGPRPVLIDADGQEDLNEVEPIGAWRRTLARLVSHWAT